MARTDVHVYKLSEKGREKGIHRMTVMVAGDQVTLEAKGGFFRCPDPGIPNPDAHHLKFVGTEGPGHGSFVDPELVAANMAVKKAEDELREADKDLQYAIANKKKLKPEDVVKNTEADEEIKLLTEALEACKADLIKAKKALLN